MMSWYKNIVALAVGLFITYTQVCGGAGANKGDSCPSDFEIETCENGGTCVVDFLSGNFLLYTCQCPEHFTGRRCEQDADALRLKVTIAFPCSLLFVVVMIGVAWVFRHTLRNWCMRYRRKKPKSVFTALTPAYDVNVPVDSTSNGHVVVPFDTIPQTTDDDNQMTEGLCDEFIPTQNLKEQLVKSDE